MSYSIEINRKPDFPVSGEIFRIILGLAALLIGLYIAAFSDIKGHGLGMLLVFSAPFFFLNEDK